MKDPVYYIVLFKIEGLKKWRAVLLSREEDLEGSLGSDNMSKITEKKVFIIDRLNGEINHE